MKDLNNAARGFTLVELLVVIAIVGIVAALLLPAVQAARESARSLSCKNNLKQIALATQNFHESRGHFPAARIAPRPGDPPQYSCGGTEPSWIVHLLPYLEQSALGEQWRVFQPCDSHPVELRSAPLSMFICPSRRGRHEAVIPVTTVQKPDIILPCGCVIPGGVISTLGGAVGDYGGNLGDPSPGATGLPSDFYFGGNGTGVIVASRPICRGGVPVDWLDKLSASGVRDGLSNTALAGEMFLPQGKLLAFPEDSPLYGGDQFTGFVRIGGVGLPIARGPVDPTGSRYSFGSWHPATCHFAFADGSVRGLSPQLSTSVLAALLHREDGKQVDLPE